MSMTGIHDDLLARQTAMKKRIWTWCIWSWPVCAIGFLVPFVFFAGLIPPPSPSMSAQEIADMIAGNRTGIRIGVIGALWFSALLLPFYAVIAAEMKKIEGELPLLAPIQFASSAILVCFFQIIGLAWLLMTYRPEINPEIMRTLNDYCWFVWSMLIPTYIFQYASMALAGFMDIRPQPLWPRWAAFFNLWVAVTGAGGFLAVFFKSGPFAWNGIVGFWIPVILFGLGNTVTMILLLRRQRYEEAQAQAAPELPKLAGGMERRPTPGHT